MIKSCSACLVKTMYIHEPLNEPLLSPSKTIDRSDSGCLCINIHILYVDYVCVCILYLQKLYILPTCKKTKWVPRSRPSWKKTILPTYIICINYYQLLITTNPYQSLYQLLITMKVRYIQLITISVVNHYPIRYCYINC